jgi:hypothetical protein
MKCLSSEITSIAGNAETDPLSYMNAEDMFSTASGLLASSVREFLQQTYRELRIPLSYSAMRGLDVPLKLFAPDKIALEGLRSRIPLSFRVFCSFEVDTGGEVRVDKLCIDGDDPGSVASSLFFTRGDDVLSITVAHAVGRLADSGDDRLISHKIIPEFGVDIAIVRVDQSNVNPVPYSHPLSFSQYAGMFSLTEQVKVYKIGPQTGMTVGVLDTYRDPDNRWAARHHTRELKLDEEDVVYSMLTRINWLTASPTTHIPFAVPGDSGNTIFGIHGERFYPLGLHCCSSTMESFAVGLEFCLDIINSTDGELGVGQGTTNGDRIKIVDTNGSYLFKNPQNASFINTRPAEVPIGEREEREEANLASFFDFTESE